MLTMNYISIFLLLPLSLSAPQSQNFTPVLPRDGALVPESCVCCVTDIGHILEFCDLPLPGKQPPECTGAIIYALYDCRDCLCDLVSQSGLADDSDLCPICPDLSSCTNTTSSATSFTTSSATSWCDQLAVQLEDSWTVLCPLCPAIDGCPQDGEIYETEPADTCK